MTLQLFDIDGFISQQTNLNLVKIIKHASSALSYISDDSTYYIKDIKWSPVRNQFIIYFEDDIYYSEHEALIYYSYGCTICAFNIPANAVYVLDENGKCDFEATERNINEFKKVLTDFLDEKSDCIDLSEEKFRCELVEDEE